MKRIIVCILILTTILGYSQSPDWALINASVKFKIKNAGFNVEGKFDSPQTMIQFDGSKGFGNTIEASIDAKSINTSNGTRDGHLKKVEYFDAQKFPKISMKATLFSKEKDGSYKGFFKIIIKDKSKDFFIPFTFAEKDGVGVFKASFSINRLDFNVGESSMILSNNVNIYVELNVKKK
jgi:polyisoprenoid-binding protein YceI